MKNVFSIFTMLMLFSFLFTPILAEADVSKDKCKEICKASLDFCKNKVDDEEGFSWQQEEAVIYACETGEMSCKNFCTHNVWDNR